VVFGLRSLVFEFIGLINLSSGEPEMEKTNFVHLHIYKLSEQLADEIWNIVLRWNFLAKHTVGIQIIKAADSIGANIAEGSGRKLILNSGASSESHEVHSMRHNIG
jgi:hypothetical protein